MWSSNFPSVRSPSYGFGSLVLGPWLERWLAAARFALSRVSCPSCPVSCTSAWVDSVELSALQENWDYIYLFFSMGSGTLVTLILCKTGVHACSRLVRHLPES